ncbi:hypothetical protein [Roseateles sp.]|uniref:hypothetical protein n=1 Tax=Roseateles sp. TaxID=1971397 RepID=UPI003BAC68A4
MSRATIRPSVHISLDSDSTAVGQQIAMDILADEKLTAQEKALELTEAVLSIVLNSQLESATEQIYGIARFVVDTSGVRMQ